MKTQSLKSTVRPQQLTGFLSGFQSIRPEFVTSQKDLLNWLVEAHARAGQSDRATYAALFERFSAAADHIAQRGHELADFSHQRWEAMRLFGPAGSDLSHKTAFFAERVNAVFERFYPLHTAAPSGLVHVTCTGYISPSGAQRLVSQRGWGRQTQVLHAYHMGCYAAHPAVRMASSLSTDHAPADIVHTELCSLHFDPTQNDPAHRVIQSLFADGFMKYQFNSQANGTPVGLEILAAHDEILPQSTGAMAWATGPLTFAMKLSKEVPVLLASALPRFVQSILEAAGLDPSREKARAVFAIHPGGPRIIELAQKILGLQAEQVHHSRAVLHQHGNMSSATLPHIWQRIVQDPKVEVGTVVVSLGAGPGLTLSGMIFVKASP